MNEHDARRYRSQTGSLRTATVIELRQALHTMRDDAAALAARLEQCDRLDEHDREALDALIGAAVQAGRKAATLETIDWIVPLVPLGDADEDDEQAGDL